MHKSANDAIAAPLDHLPPCGVRAGGEREPLYAPAGAGWGMVAQRRHKSTDALADELISACDELLAAGKRINWVFLGAPGVGRARTPVEFRS